MKQVFSISFRAVLFIVLRKVLKKVYQKVNPDRNWSQIELYMIPLKMRGMI